MGVQRIGDAENGASGVINYVVFAFFWPNELVEVESGSQTGGVVQLSPSFAYLN